MVHNEDHINVTDDLTLSMVTLIGAQAQVDLTSVTLGASDSADLACRTSSQVYPPLVSTLDWTKQNLWGLGAES